MKSDSFVYDLRTKLNVKKLKEISYFNYAEGNEEVLETKLHELILKVMPNGKLIVFKPELQELVYGTIEEITNFGAFISMGPIRGMIHISQTMDDFVSFSDTGVLTGKNGKKNLMQGDKCIARIVAISYKGEEPKIGLTMRQPGLGKLDWVKAEKEKNEKQAKQLAAVEAKTAKKEKKK